MHRNTMLAGLAGLVTVGLLTGCSTPESLKSTTIFCEPFPDEPAIIVKPLDAQTGKALELKAGGYIQDGSYFERFKLKTYEDPLKGEQVWTLIAGIERPGTYDVVIEREGYKTWTAQGVQVTQNGCKSVNPMIFTAYLEPEPETE